VEHGLRVAIAQALDAGVVRSSPLGGGDVARSYRAELDDGRVVFNHSVERSTDELHGTPGGFGFTERIPVQNWTPGLYVLQIDAKSRLTDIAPASRVIQFEVR